MPYVSLATPGTEACDAVGGAFRPQWTEWPSSEYWTSSVVRAEVALRIPLSALCVRYVYSFLGPLAGSALGGDFNLAFTFLDVPKVVRYGTSATGFVLLPCFMFFMGGRLVGWAPSNFGRAKAVGCTTVAPWLIGTALILLVYWPLPSFLIGSTLGGSVFWLFAVMGATFGFSTPRPAETISSFSGWDFMITLIAVAMVRLLVNGVRLTH